MKETITERGFRLVTHKYNLGGEGRLVQESSAIGHYDDSYAKPGSSYLWLGEEHHLDRTEVAMLRDYLDHWLTNGRLGRGRMTKGR